MKSTKLPCNDCPSKGESVFCKLEAEVLNNLTDAKIMNTYKKGQSLFNEGAPPFGLFCISTGKIKLTRTSPEGKDAIIRIAGPGDILGQQALSNEPIYSETATALEEAQVCFIDKKYIENLMQHSPAVAMEMIKKLSHEMSHIEGKVAHYFQKNVRERLAELLLEFKEKYGEKLPDGRIVLNIKLTREEIASMVGVATETLIRFISEFKDEGILDQEGKTLYILDSDKLKEFSNCS